MLRIARTFRTHAALAFGTGTLCFAFASAAQWTFPAEDRDIKNYGNCTVSSISPAVFLSFNTPEGRFTLPSPSKRHILSCANKGISAERKLELLGYDSFPSFSLTCDDKRRNVTLDRGTGVIGSIGERVPVRYGWSSWNNRSGVYDMHEEYWLHEGNGASVCHFGCRDSKQVDTTMDLFFDGMASEDYLIFSIGGKEYNNVFYDEERVRVPVGKTGFLAALDFQSRCGEYKRAPEEFSRRADGV